MKNNYALSFSSSTYKNHVLEGFSRLQQNDEFVDMTLAAEGHWVKVHRTLVALASPYLRELLQSLPCQHPIMYLYGVSHEALGFILEYLYTGQVEIPAEKVQSFLDTARDMQIAGLKNVVPPDENETPRREKKSREPLSSAAYKSTNNENNTNFQSETPIIVGDENKDAQSLYQKITPINTFKNTRNIPSEAINIDMTELASSSNDMNQSHVPLQDISNANMATETMNINLPDFAENNVMIEKPQIIRNISAPNKIINITMDGAVINDINQDLTSNELPNDGNINAQNNMFTITLEESENAKNNINEESRSDELPDLVNIDTPDINMTLEETSETYDETETNENYPSIQVPSISNIKVPGKTINITLDESASNNIGTKKPVAKIEILSSTVIKNGNGDMNSGQTWQLPKVYAQALADMNNQNTSRHHETSTQSVKSASRSLMDINQLLDFRDDVPMEEDNQHELETPVSSGNVEKLTVSEHDETVPRQSDSVLYTASNRGALQLILNRFMYYCHYQRQNGRKRRWRCIEYRDQKCLAAIDTVGEQIVERKHIHCHPNHDDKICRKMTRRDVKVFTTIQMAEDVLKKKKTS